MFFHPHSDVPDAVPVSTVSARRFLPLRSGDSHRSDVPGALLPDVPDALLPDVPGVLLPDVPDALPPDVPGVLPPDVPGALLLDVPGVLPPDVPGALLPDVPGVLLPDVPGALLPDVPDAPASAADALPGCGCCFLNSADGSQMQDFSSDIHALRRSRGECAGHQGYGL